MPGSLAARLEQPEENRGGHVVGQIAGHPEIAVGDRLQVEVEEVLLDERDVRRQPRRQCLGHLAIQFDGGQVGDPWRKAQRKRAGAGTNLEETVGRLWRDRLDELVGPRGLEEVLSELFLGPDARLTPHHTSSSDSPRQYFSSISSISSSLMPKWCPNSWMTVSATQSRISSSSSQASSMGTW